VLYAFVLFINNGDNFRVFVKTGNAGIPNVRGRGSEEICDSFHGSCMVRNVVNMETTAVMNYFRISPIKPTFVV